MKAATLSKRPGFSLMRQSDVQSFYHLQMPRWLFYDKRYMPLSLEAKVVYTFLLNRFQLSKLNNWINDDGEVFIIYTRQSLADEIQISYRRVIECVKELKALELIWEHRCGRGDANQIYLARAGLTGCCDCSNDGGYDSAPFTAQEDSRHADSAHLDGGASHEPEAQTLCPQDEAIPPRPVETAHHEVQNQYVKSCENGTSRSAGMAFQDLREPHASYIDKNNTDFSDIDSQSVRHAHTRARASPDRRADGEIEELDGIIERCDLWTFPLETAKVFESAIERLYFSESFKIGNCTLPQRKVRSHLNELDNIKLQTAEYKISRNTDTDIRNTTAYTMAVVFNSIWETESDLMNDPYLNSLSNTSCPVDPERRDG